MAPVTTTRTFAILGYTFSNGVLYAEPFARRSAIFALGGFDWSIRYYPTSLFDADGIDLCPQLDSTAGSRVTASFDVDILDPTGSLPPWKLEQKAPVELNDDTRELVRTLPRSFLYNTAPDPRYLTRGGLLFGCTITVFTEAPAPTTVAALSRANAPASDMMEQLGKIFATEDGADVTYSVHGELFRAHKIILAMRSPVFKAQLYGGTIPSTAPLIEVEDMLPDVFRALLRYVYTDTLPATDGLADEDASQVISRLLVAADRYGVEKLRILCECKLCNLVVADNLVKMLVFAEEHHCNMLRDACIEFMATSDSMQKVEASHEYVQMRSTHHLILIDALEKTNKFRRESILA